MQPSPACFLIRVKSPEDAKELLEKINKYKVCSAYLRLQLFVTACMYQAGVTE
jgi:hypothetical protein